MRSLTLIMLLLLLAPAGYSQAPHEPWRTLETPHFRVHFPAAYEAWARRAAERLEASRTAVGNAVGFEVRERVEVLVMDPLATANGSALPIIGWPRMILWTTPPSASSSIGTSRDWIELLTVHEQAHMAHILRPSRNWLQRLSERFILPLGPIAAAPRWVHEGYATVIEGELTGSGRPNGDMRAVLLRTLARNGRLPTYAQLSSDRRNWQGMSMAYLAGSAYLEWLRDRSGPDSLRHLWARMTARRRRSFDAAFLGVFGESAPILYGRFVAEVTGRAMQVEREIAPTLREGEIFQDLSWTTEAPQVSADGKKIVTVLRSRDLPSKMVIWSTEPDQKEETKWRERIDKILKADPEDVRPVRTRPLPRKAVHTLETRSGAEPWGPKWLAGGSVIFVRLEPDQDGFLHSDLFRWDPAQETVARVTDGADLSDPDPHPDATRAVAVRNRHGFSQLVEIDLGSGQIRELSPPSIDRIYETPRWSPDGNSIVYVRHEQGRWRLILRDAAGGEEREIPTPSDDVMPLTPAWSSDSSTVFAVLGRGGFLEIHSVSMAGGEWRAVTRSFHGSMAPTVAGDELYYLSVEIDGLDVRHLSLPEEGLPPLSVSSALAPVVRPVARPTPFRSTSLDLGPSRDYGIGRLEWTTLFGGSETPSSRSLEVGLRLGDVLGRTSSILMGSMAGEGSESGASFSTVWRGWPVELKAHLFNADHDLSTQPGLPDGLIGPAGREQRGIEISGSRTWRARARRIDLTSGLLHQSVRPDGSDATSSATSGFFEPRIRYTPSAGDFHFGMDLGGRWDGGDDSARWGAELAGSIRKGETALGLGYAHRWTDHQGLLLGGTASSILPASARSERVLQAALPIGILTGSEYVVQRASIDSGFLPLALFYERHRMLGASDQWSELALLGAQLTLSTDPMPILQFPGLDLRFGAARIFDEPMEGETTWWLTLAWRP